VKKSGKIVEAPPSAAAGWKPSIFLGFEGGKNPCFYMGQNIFDPGVSPALEMSQA
jgi:hypothetical protein